MGPHGHGRGALPPEGAGVAGVDGVEGLDGVDGFAGVDGMVSEMLLKYCSMAWRYCSGGTLSRPWRNSSPNLEASVFQALEGDLGPPSLVLPSGTSLPP